MKEIMLNGKELTLESLIQITRGNAHVCASLAAMEDVKRSRSLVEALVAGGRPMYGINTGFGLFSEVAIPEEDINLLQIKLILADAAGVGAPLPVDVVRGMLVMRANSLLNGFSGVRPVVINTILDMLNRGVHPVVPEKGSVGSSGDLCPLAHMAVSYTHLDVYKRQDSAVGQLFDLWFEYFIHGKHICMCFRDDRSNFDYIFRGSKGCTCCHNYKRRRYRYQFFHFTFSSFKMDR